MLVASSSAALTLVSSVVVGVSALVVILLCEIVHVQGLNSNGGDAIETVHVHQSGGL